MKEKTRAGRNFPKKLHGYAYFIILHFVAEQQMEKETNTIFQVIF